MLFLGNMFAGFGTLFYVVILLLNAICILSEDRFLARVGWSRSRQNDISFGVQNDPNSLKARGIDAIFAIRTATRIPLIAVNSLVILYLLLLG